MLFTGLDVFVRNEHKDLVIQWSQGQHSSKPSFSLAPAWDFKEYI